MYNLLSSIRRFLSELRRRNVYQVAVTYIVVGFFVIEAADLTLTRLGLPPWTVTLVVVLVGLGFPIALVMAWALEMTPDGVRVEESGPEETASSEEAPAPMSTTRDLWVGGSVLALLLLGAWWLYGGLSEEEGAGNASQGPAGRTAETEKRTIAVLPFEVSGSGAEEWRDGMVTTLSLNLDGAAGLRAIADRTVFAAWKQAEGTEEGTSTVEALSVARKVGARYAIVGSAVQLGEDLRFAAEVYGIRSEERLGQVEVRGAPGSVTALTDRLTRRVLGVLLDRSEEAIPSVDLASITTSSLDALRAYLRGERHFRASEFESAVEDYEAAVETDSSFALAYSRLAVSHWWLVEEKQRNQYWRRAHGLSGRLPKRERGVVRASYLRDVADRALAAADTLRRLTREYPDDPSVWYQLGETVFHNSVPRGWPEADTAFGRAVDLDPGMAPYHNHYLHLAIGVHRDSTITAQRLSSYPTGGFWKRGVRNSMDLVFGSQQQRERVLAGLDSLPVIDWTLQHPVDMNLFIRVHTATEDGEGIPRFLPQVLIASGRVEEGLTAARKASWSPATMACLLVYPESLSLPIPDSLASRYLEPKNLPTEASVDRLKCTGLYLVDQDREKELAGLLDRLRSATDTTQGERSLVSETQPVVAEVEGYRAFRAGNFEEAARLWSRSNESALWGAIWRGDLYRRLGELKKAEGWYLAAWRDPVAHKRLGQLYEEMGKPKKAAEAYERFIEAWKEADPELQPRVETAQERLRALTDASATPAE